MDGVSLRHQSRGRFFIRIEPPHSDTRKRHSPSGPDAAKFSSNLQPAWIGAKFAITADTIKLFLIGLPVPVYLQLSLEALKVALDQRLILMRIGTNFGPPTKLLTMRFGLPISSIPSMRGRSSWKKMDISMRARNMPRHICRPYPKPM